MPKNAFEGAPPAEERLIIDLSCPVEMRGYELLYDDLGRARAYIDLSNVSDHTLSAYRATARWSVDGTDLAQNDYVKVDSLEVPPGSNFRLMLSAAAPLHADRLEMYFSDCEFTDAGPWKAESGDLVDVGETHTLQGKELERLKKRAGDDAIIYPETQDRFWRCVCGRINPLTEDVCARCRRARETVLKDLNAREMRRPGQERRARKARQEAAAQASARPIEPERKIRFYTAIMAFVTVAFLALAAILALS